MQVDINTIVSITEANQNFSRVARLVDEKGLAVILKNNEPRYVVVDFNQFESEKSSQNEQVMSIARRILEKNRLAFEELAK